MLADRPLHWAGGSLTSSRGTRLQNTQQAVKQTRRTAINEAKKNQQSNVRRFSLAPAKTLYPSALPISCSTARCDED